jgi:hypothetical protein
MCIMHLGPNLARPNRKQGSLAYGGWAAGQSSGGGHRLMVREASRHSGRTRGGGGGAVRGPEVACRR